LARAPHASMALFKILSEEKENENLVNLSLEIIKYDLFALARNVSIFQQKKDFVDTFVDLGICELLIQIIETYAVKYTPIQENDDSIFNKNTNIISSAFFIISELISFRSWNIFSHEYISRFIAAGLLNCIVKIYNSPLFCDEMFFPRGVCNMIESLCVFDVNIIQQFRLKGILRNSDFFRALPTGLRSHVFVLM
jgi:hypothetical protein